MKKAGGAAAAVALLLTILQSSESELEEDTIRPRPDADENKVQAD